MKADMLKKLLQAGALAAEAGSRGSAGNIASKIVDSGLDLSDWKKKNNKPDKKKDKSKNNGNGPPSSNEEKNPDINYF
jgi:hypothetical protein